MSKQARRNGQSAMDWLAELVASDPEAQKAYEDEELRIQLSGALRESREAAGMTQAMVAEAMGIKQSLVSKLERPDHNHTVGTVLSYLQAVRAGLVMAIVAANGRDLLSATALAENAVLFPEEVRKQAESMHMSLREYVFGCLAHHHTANEMKQAFVGELRQHMGELEGRMAFQQPKSSPIRVQTYSWELADTAGTPSYAKAA